MTGLRLRPHSSEVHDALTGAPGSDELLKQALRKRIIGHALRMPLDSDHPVRISCPFHGFDNAVWGVSRDVQILSWLRNGLVMRAVDGGLGAACDGSQTATGL